MNLADLIRAALLLSLWFFNLQEAVFPFWVQLLIIPVLAIVIIYGITNAGKLVIATAFAAPLALIAAVLVIGGSGLVVYPAFFLGFILGCIGLLLLGIRNLYYRSRKAPVERGLGQIPLNYFAVGAALMIIYIIQSS